MNAFAKAIGLWIDAENEKKNMRTIGFTYSRA